MTDAPTDYLRRIRATMAIAGLLLGLALIHVKPPFITEGVWPAALLLLLTVSTFQLLLSIPAVWGFMQTDAN